MRTAANQAKKRQLAPKLARGNEKLTGGTFERTSVGINSIS